jgi:hypothetical protein
MPNEVFSTDFPLDETLCRDCIYRFSRLVEPLDPEEFGITEEVLNELDIKDDDDIIVEQHTCLITYQDLDGMVKKCTHFKKYSEIQFFHNNPY